MDRKVRSLVRSLRGADSVARQWAVVERWVETRDIVRIREASAALSEAAQLDDPTWAARSVLDHLARLQALAPSGEFAPLVLELARRGNERYLASLLASAQSTDVVADLVVHREQRDDECLACLVQELVLRVKHLDLEPFLSFWKDLTDRGHPLSWLPLHLAEVETSIFLPSYTVRGGSLDLPFAPIAERSGSRGLPRVSPISHEVTSAGDANLISAAFLNWQVEAAVFAQHSGHDRAPLDEVLVGTNLQCLSGAEKVQSIGLSASDAFQIAFSAASAGGAYNTGRYGAYGRLEAWKTMTGLARASTGDKFPDVSELVTRTRWFLFETSSPWFYGVLWDIGLVAESLDGTTLSVLAATDTD